ncbi:hypothetical protein BDZ97DRAFT_2060968 [Flammula alnicola]|nr:hypothetical protein BDZ97DRAFT_2060968 [Flammula alnicola]
MPSFFKSLLVMSLLAMGSVMHAAAQAPCLPVTAGNYSIESAGFTGGFLTVGRPVETGNLTVLETAPPKGQLGVWTLTNADQGGFHILNIELARNVTTLHLTESNLFLAQVAVAGAPATIYGIECAGNGEYVIKTINEDQLWTAVAITRPVAPPRGLALASLPARFIGFD